MTDNLLIAVLGNQNSGKSHTWNTLFGYTVKTGSNIRDLFLTNKEYVEVFLVSGSPEERQLYVGDIIGKQKPRIVLCSMQYINNVRTTINYFTKNNFSLFIHWLNPGHKDNHKQQDSCNIVDYILSQKSMFGIRDGRINATTRVEELRNFIYGWASSRRLIKP